jgi:predicted amidophosphoribosyltransferase
MNTEPIKPDDFAICKKCGQPVQFDNDGFCPECGTRPVPLPGEMGVCKQCDQAVTFDQDGFCPKCGTQPTSLRGDFETCKACGQPVKKFDRDSVCPKCGKPRPPEKQVKVESGIAQGKVGQQSGLTTFDKASLKIMNIIAIAVLIFIVKSCQSH